MLSRINARFFILSWSALVVVLSVVLSDFWAVASCSSIVDEPSPFGFCFLRNSDSSSWLTFCTAVFGGFAFLSVFVALACDLAARFSAVAFFRAFRAALFWVILTLGFFLLGTGGGVFFSSGDCFTCWRKQR